MKRWTYTRMDECQDFWAWLLCEWSSGIRILGIEYDRAGIVKADKETP